MYTYLNFLNDIDYLVFKGLKRREIGLSALGNPIVAIETGNRPDVIITGGIHARENISVFAAMMVAFSALRNGINNLAVIPLLNPDGALLVEKGAFFEGSEWLSELCNGDFSYWKANANAVDLNVNFDAEFGRGKQNVFAPAPQNYVGPYAFSEPETRAIRDYTLELMPALTLSFHSSGREIYWFFGQSAALAERDRAVAQAFSEITGYARIDSDLGSAGGYKDWCISKLGITALTFELSVGKHPLPESAYDDEWFGRLLKVPQTASELGAALRDGRF